MGFRGGFMVFFGFWLVSMVFQVGFMVFFGFWLVSMVFLFTMNLCLPWVLNFNLSQARSLTETACNYVFSVLVHGIPSISAWISIHQNSQKFFCAKTSIGH